MQRALVLFTLAVAAGASAFFFQCGGPRPVVEDVRLARTPAGWTLRADVVNTARGRGQVQVVLRLRDAAGVVREEVQRLQMGRGDRMRVSATFDLPDEHYTAEVTAQYPPL